MQFTQRAFRRFLILSGCAGLGLVSACGGMPTVSALGTPPVNSGTENLVIKARIALDVNLGGSGETQQNELSLTSAPSGSVPVSLMLAGSTSFAIDASQFVVPSLITSSTIALGSIAVSSLQDNSLKVCGSNGHQKCSTALLRMYTTGAGGAGLYNSADGYGAPLRSGLTNSSYQEVGLGSAGAVVLASYAIPSNQNVLRLSDFASTPRFNVSADLSNAGAGSYATTIVIEYALAP